MGKNDEDINNTNVVYLNYYQRNKESKKKKRANSVSCKIHEY